MLQSRPVNPSSASPGANHNQRPSEQIVPVEQAAHSGGIVCSPAQAFFAQFLARGGLYGSPAS